MLSMFPQNFTEFCEILQKHGNSTATAKFSFTSYVRVVQPFGYGIDFILGVAGQYSISAAIKAMLECEFQ